MGTKKLVMVVDDESLIDSLMEQQVRKAGYEAISFTEAEKALEYFVNNPERVHLAVVDVIMPGMNGKELYDLLKRGRPELRALFMSGYPGEVIGRHGILDEGIDFLKKPFTPADLSRKIRGVLGN